MCGIVGITAETDVAAALLAALRHLEYRGYDSCGMALINQGVLEVRKQIGDVTSVAERERLKDMCGSLGIAHTRWATHGGVSQANAHPHLSHDGHFALVHNGIIHNHAELRTKLEKQDISFVSQTDSEVIVNLLAAIHQQHPLPQALLHVCQELQGNYAFCFIQSDSPHTLYCVRQGAPLVLGLGKQNHCVASDIPALMPFTRTALVMEDGEYAVLTPQQVKLRHLQTDAIVRRAPFQIEWDVKTTHKGRHAHYMLKEIFEQPEALQNALAVSPHAITQMAQQLIDAKRVFLTGVGTTHYVAMLGQYLFARLGGLSATAINSDEFLYLVEPQQQDMVLGISQSGETHDTRQAVLAAKKATAHTAAIVNMMGSSLAMDVDQVILQGSGPEICVVSTKAALAQVFILLRLAVAVGMQNGKLDKKESQYLLREMKAFPELVGRVLNERSGAIRTLAEEGIPYANWLLLGRGLHHPAAMETALKLKEITYLHVEGMPAGFLKHGALAMIDEHMLNFFLLPPAGEKHYAASFSALEEVHARRGYCMGFYHQNDNDAPRLLHKGLSLPTIHPLLSPLLQMVMGQLLAYFAALRLDRSIDKPRNLAKSVTVG